MPLPRSLRRSLIATFALVAAVVAPGAAEAFSPFLVVPDPAVAEASPAYRYANMTDAEALAELGRRHVPFQKVDSAAGVRAPIRLAGRLHGVHVHSVLPVDQRATTPFEILDARLALALDDFCALLERHDIDELVHYTMYRPGAAAPRREEAPVTAGPRAVQSPGGPAAQAPAKAAGARPRPAAEAKKAAPARGAVRPVKHAPGKSAPAPAGGARQPSVKKVAKRDAASTGMHPTSWAAPGTRHPAGLAIDVGMLRKRDGRWISVARDFHGKIGQRTCGEGAFAPENADARELRALVCESAEIGVFTYVLTPDYDAAHADHLHMEIKSGVKWFLYH